MSANRMASCRLAPWLGGDLDVEVVSSQEPLRLLIHMPLACWQTRWLRPQGYLLFKGFVDADILLPFPDFEEMPPWSTSPAVGLHSSFFAPTRQEYGRFKTTCSYRHPTVTLPALTSPTVLLACRLRLQRQLHVSCSVVLSGSMADRRAAGFVVLSRGPSWTVQCRGQTTRHRVGPYHWAVSVCVSAFCCKTRSA